MYLIADIGATNARFQLADDQGLLDQPLVLSTAAYQQAEELLAAARDGLGVTNVSAALLAVAGPVDADGGVVVTNTGLPIAPQHGVAVLGQSLRLVNDFYALAHAIPHAENLVQIGGEPASSDVKALLGPGSGLGMAGLVPVAADQWRVIASEGGHADLAIASHLDAELWSVLQQQHTHVCWETVLCGPGLVNLYGAVATLWGVTPQALTPAQISDAGMTLADPVCHQTLDTFCNLLGAAAGNLALIFGAKGGVYIGGGITAKLADFLPSSGLRRRFDERGELSDYVEPIPIFLVLDEQPGLLGAYHCLRQKGLQQQA